MHKKFFIISFFKNSLKLQIVLSILIFCSTGLAGNVKNITLGGKDEYSTSLGTLKDGFVILDGEATLSGNNMDLKYGVVFFDKHKGIPVKNNIEIYDGKVSQSDLKITFIQDTKTKKWIATDGLGFYDFKKDVFQLIDGTEILIVGGNEMPLIISGSSYYDTKLKINDRKVLDKKNQ